MSLSSLAVLLWAFRRAGKHQDRDRPEIVSLNARSKAVLDRAQHLAREGREDAQAVTELRAVAGRRGRALRGAERASRLAGYHHERRQANLTNRLLHAAVTRKPVAALTPAERQRIEAIEAFSELPRSEQWASLCALQPRLEELETEARAGGLGEMPLRSEERAPTEEEIRQLREWGHAHEELTRQLKSLVGPACSTEDVLLGSQFAFDSARSHLLRREG